MQQQPHYILRNWEANVELIYQSIVNTESYFLQQIFNRQTVNKHLSTSSLVLAYALSLSPDRMTWIKELVLPEYMAWINEPYSTRGCVSGVGSSSRSPPKSPVKSPRIPILSSQLLSSPVTTSKTLSLLNEYNPSIKQYNNGGGEKGGMAAYSSFNTSSSAKDHVSGMVLCKGVSTIKGFDSRLQRELNPPYIRSTLALRPLSLLFPTQILSADSYFRVLPIAAIKNNTKRREATILESFFSIPTGELNFGLGVYIETLHLALIGAPLKVILKFSSDNQHRFVSHDKKRNAFMSSNEYSVSSIFHNKCIPLAIERAIQKSITEQDDGSGSSETSSLLPLQFIEDQTENGLARTYFKNNGSGNNKESETLLISDSIEEELGIKFASTPVSAGALNIVFSSILAAIKLHNNTA